MYKKAFAGEIKNFTGVTDPYEPPLNPEIVIETQNEEPEVSAARILDNLERMGFIDPADEPAYSADDAEIIRDRLVKLGYMGR
jgi:hypothetical protein